MLLRFKRKNLVLEEISSESGHRDQISSLVVGSGDSNSLLVTASHDMTIGYHRLGEKQLIHSTLLKIAIDHKVNDMVLKD
jgi:hypothetical protein